MEMNNKLKIILVASLLIVIGLTNVSATSVGDSIITEWVNASYFNGSGHYLTDIDRANIPGQVEIDTWQNETYSNTSNITEGTNLYYADARARAAITAVAPLSYNPSTGEASIVQAGAGTDGFLSALDWNIFDAKPDKAYVDTNNSEQEARIQEVTAANALLNGSLWNYTYPSNIMTCGDTCHNKHYVNYTMLNASVQVPSTAQVTGLDTALAGKEPTVTGSTNNVFWNGQKAWIALNSANISDFTTAVRSQISAGANLTYNSATGVFDYIVPTDLNFNTTYDAYGIRISNTEANDTSLLASVNGKEPAITGSTYDKFWNGQKGWIVPSLGNLSDGSRVAGTEANDTTLKAQVASLQTNDTTGGCDTPCEKISNKSSAIDTSTSSYPNNGAVKTYVDNGLAGKQASGTYVTAVSGGSSPITSSGTTSITLGCTASSTSVAGCLSSTDWNTFNGKQAPLGYTPARINTGSYTGSGTTNKSVAHGLGVVPKGFIIYLSSTGRQFSWTSGDPYLHYLDAAADTVRAIKQPDATNIDLCVSDFNQCANAGSTVYRWIAWG